MADAWTAKIDAYADGELSPQDEQAFADHMRQCTACAAETAARTRLKRQVQLSARKYVPDEAFVRRMQSKLAGGKSYRWRFWTASAVAAVLFVALVVQVLAPRQHPAIEIADLHVTALASPNPVEVVSSDRHTVKPWFQGKIPFTFELPDLQGTDFTLLGGRLVYVNQAPAAQLIYQIRQHKISVFIVQERDAPRMPSGLRTQNTFSTDSWQAGGLAYALVGDVGQEDVGKLADLLKRAK